MKVLKNPLAALIIALAVVVGSTSANLSRSLEKEIAAVDAVWNETNGIADQLHIAASNASQLWSVTQGLPGLDAENAALRDAYNALYDSMEADDVPGLAAHAGELNKAVEAISFRLLSGSQFSDKAALAQRYAGMVTNACRVMNSSAYNDAVTKYYAKTGEFPVTVFRSFLSVDEPDYFIAP